MEQDCGDGMSGRYGAMSWDGRASGSSDGRSGCKGTVQWEIATGRAVACMHDAWLRWERLLVQSRLKKRAVDARDGSWLQVQLGTECFTVFMEVFDEHVLARISKGQQWAIGE